jgi:hypothetical protein
VIATEALTVVAPIAGGADEVARLRDRLRTIQDDLLGKRGTNQVFLPAQLPDTHFMRLVIVDDTHGGGELAPLLAWESNHDGTTDDYLRKVAREAARPDRCLDLDAVFGACAGYPTGGVRDVDGFVAWMRRHAVRAEAFYCAYPGVTKQRVDHDRRLHDEIRTFLDAERPRLVGAAGVVVHDRVVEHLRGRGLDVSRPVDGAGARWWRTVLRLIPIAVALLLTWPLWLPIVAYLWFWKLPRLEATDKPATYHRPVHGAPDLIAAEDHIVQNQLTHLVDIKPGWARYVILRLVLCGIDTLARLYFVHGNLGGITSIHFARWVIIEDRRPRRDVRVRRHRLLFFSNYDFSWDSYLGEFVDRAARGLTAVWSNTVGFPRTRKLLEDGARDEERFKQWARDQQLRTDVWWSGVADATVDNVRAALAIRDGLATRPDYEELTRWLRRL